MSDDLALRLKAPFGFTDQEARFVSAVMSARITASFATVFAAICRDESNPPNDEILKVLACRARKKLARALNTNRAIIDTVWGRGYRISDDDKALLRERAGIQPLERAA